ncbi:hypothetical protein DIPPA_11620 [Diplonema papillatum]|nr:hypothetical protein DIPPA_11620 [Diplonema papillatum]
MAEWYEGLSGLAIASRLDHVEIVEQLLKARALVESFEHDITHLPLSYAANEGNEAIVALLLARTFNCITTSYSYALHLKLTCLQ